MTSLRNAARGKPCMIRIPGICSGNPETTVLAHYRLNTGGALKPHDLQGAWACSACHDVVDGRVRTDLYTRGELRLMHAEGCFRTQEALRRAA